MKGGANQPRLSVVIPNEDVVDVNTDSEVDNLSNEHNLVSPLMLDIADIDESLAEEVSVALGSADQPQTDSHIILRTVQEFSEQQEKHLLGQEGWIHIQSEFFIPEEMKGDGGLRSVQSEKSLTMEELFPGDVLILDKWFYVNGDQFYSAALETAYSPDGTKRQSSIYMNGIWSNIILKEAGFSKEEYSSEKQIEVVTLPASRVLQMLEEKQAWEGINFRGYVEGDQYIIIEEMIYEEPIDAILMPAPVLGEREIFTFDRKTGQLLFREVGALLENGSWLVLETEKYSATEFVFELPPETAQLFNDSAQTLKEDE